MSPTAAAYPYEREADVVLRDGATTHVRPVRADDAAAVHKFLEALSPDSIGYRFFGAANLDWATQWSVDVDYADRFALVVESGNPRAIVAHALYVRIDPDRARGGVCRRRRLARAGNLDDPPRAPGGSSRDTRDFHVRRGGAAAQPSHDRRLPPERISGGPPLGPRCARDRTADLAVRRGDRSVRGTGAKRGGHGEEFPRAAPCGCDRGVSPPGNDRRRDPAQPDRHRVQGAVYAVNDKADIVRSLPASAGIEDVLLHVSAVVEAHPRDRGARLQPRRRRTGRGGDRRRPRQGRDGCATASDAVARGVRQHIHHQHHHHQRERGL